MFNFSIKSFCILLLLLTNTLADKIKAIDVVGNDRLSEATIILFSDLSVGQDYNPNILNNSIKKLYSTDFFENINISSNDGIINISVIELPVIQEIIFNGIKRQATISELKEQISLKEKNPFNNNKIKDDINTLLNIFKSTGYYFSKIDTKILKNSNNTINLIFDISRGEKVSIEKINFIGDKVFKDRKLHNIITSEEDKFWKFISNKVYLNSNRVELDKRLLKNFYLERGYYQVNIQDAYSQLTNKKKFLLTYNINAGKKYYFGEFKLNLPDDFDNDKFSNLNKIFSNIKNELYDFRKIENILSEIENVSLNANYEFINSNVEEVVEDNRINFIFNIFEDKKFYVTRVNIYGNSITEEEFIRNNLFVDEGDPFNNILHNKSINRLKSSRLFGSVESNISVDSSDDQKKIIDIYIEEKPTGEISAGAGYGTSGSSFSFGISESNFSGKGIKLSTDLSVSSDTIKGGLSVVQPNFAYSDRDLSYSLESRSTDKLEDFGYKSNSNEASVGTSYEQYQNLFFSPQISISAEDIETTNTASAAYKKQEGTYFETSFDYGLTYDKRDSRFQPSEGFVSSWKQNIPLYADDTSIYNSYSFTNYNKIADNFVVSAGIMLSSINSISSDNDVRISKRLYVPSSRLRGFEIGKVGPKDGNDYVGANYLTAFNFSSTVPYLLETFQNMDLKIFYDAANLWGVDYDSSVDDSNKVRSSTGVALEVLTPVGPLSFSLSQAITKATTDKTESFRFQLGTTF
jgi:outer membrane protein insertion porin family